MTDKAKRYKFSNNINPEFFDTLRARVNEYFDNNQIAKHGGSKLVVKTIFMFLLYIVPYVFIVSGIVTNPFLFVGMWLIMGFGGVGIGVNVMHDANHGAWSASPWWNNVMGKSVNLIGGNAKTWKLQHNVLHHAFTNVEGIDHDLDAPNFLRFSPHQVKRKYHRFQHLYAWFFYGLQTFARTLATDFTNARMFKSKGLIRKDSEYRGILWNITIGKIFYFTYILVIPMIFAPVPFWMVLIGFATMHYVSGLLLALIFQSAHVMPECQFPQPDEKGTIENSWAIHQMQTTTNFSPNSRIFSWFVGGLNFQIEHHLFSNIAHTHYRDLSKIVKSTAQEFGIQYNTQKTFAIAIWNHAKMLKQLGTA